MQGPAVAGLQRPGIDEVAVAVTRVEAQVRGGIGDDGATVEDRQIVVTDGAGAFDDVVFVDQAAVVSGVVPDPVECAVGHGDGPAADQGGFGAFVLPMIFGFLLISTIASSSGYLLQGLGEEKENRVMEIPLSSVSTRQLLIGKVFGLGLAGLFQMVFWLLSALLIVQLGSSIVGGFFDTIQVPDNFILLGLVYYILGYFLFAVIMAGIGAIAATAKEGTQLSVIMILPAILPFYIGIIFLRDHPDHVIGTILTLFPVTAPMSIFVRMGLSEIAVWEIIVSVILLIIAIVGGLWLAAKSFRAFLLMYGKAPKMSEIMRILWKA